ncbi:uncharacterized protein LOC123261626 isoform X2 [Cotesia glomerata]|uniref:uncharacterized protein LOC123261626 isoform X2 n=1 Tax=Cotesia glomerata TaxID=32391 RepID=UPI001D01A464|nr:uncharacterized protein LOC123261626 isoform X2 [Cotesia glomerata]
MNSAIFCLIFLASLTSQGCLARFKPSSAFDQQLLLSKAERDSLRPFRQLAEIITSEELDKIRAEIKEINRNSYLITKTFLYVIKNATRDVTKELMTNLTKIEADSKAKMNQASESTSGFFNRMINSVKDQHIKELIDQAERLNGSLEAKAASLRQSIDQKIGELNANLIIVVQDAFKSESANYWRQIEEHQMAKIISEARRGVEAQVSAFMTQQFTDNLQNYEAQLKRLQQTYVDETSRKIGDLEEKKNLYAQELKDLADSLKLSLEAAKEQKALQPDPVEGAEANHGHDTNANLPDHEVVNNGTGSGVVDNGASHNTNSNPINTGVVANGAGSGVVNNPADHEVVPNGDGHEIDANTVGSKPYLGNDVFEADIDNSAPEYVQTTPTSPIIKTFTESNPLEQVHSFFDQVRNKHQSQAR